MKRLIWWIFLNIYIYFEFFNKELILDESIYIFFKISIFYVILNKYKGIL